MGRPLNKRRFADAVIGPLGSLEQSDTEKVFQREIKVNFHNGTEIVEGFIVKQMATRKFKVSAVGADDTVYTRILTGGVDPAALTGDQFTISFKMVDEHDFYEVYTCSKITQYRAVLTKFNEDGSNYYHNKQVRWEFLKAAEASPYYQTPSRSGIAQIEEAGINDVIDGDGNDFLETGAPAAMSDFTVTALSATSVNLNWTKHQGIKNHASNIPPYQGRSPVTHWQYSTDIGANWSANIPMANALPYTVTGLSPSTTYKFTIRAFNTQGDTGGVGDGKGKSFVQVTTLAEGEAA